MKRDNGRLKGINFYYFSLVNSKKSPGVGKKINSTVCAAQSAGLVAKSIQHDNTLGGVKAFLKDLWQVKSGVVFIRYSDLVAPLLFVVFSWLRFKGVKVVVDIPTPRVTLSTEIDQMGTTWLQKTIRKILNYTCGGWVLLPAHLVIQYAEEGWWFCIGVRGKSIKIGNGVNVDENIPLTKANWPAKTLKLVAVAQLADWHGYDRVLKALDKVRSMDLGYDIEFTLIGDGHALKRLENLKLELKLNNVKFTGMLDGIALDKEMEDKHIGVSSLGLYRKGLNEASSLKTREYMARGLPVIDSGIDPDFSKCDLYRYTVPNTNEFKSLVDLLASFEHKDIPSSLEVRKFAEQNLSIDAKLKFILGHLYA